MMPASSLLSELRPYSGCFAASYADGSMLGQGGVHSGLTPEALCSISAIWPPSTSHGHANLLILELHSPAVAVGGFSHDLGRIHYPPCSASFSCGGLQPSSPKRAEALSYDEILPRIFSSGASGRFNWSQVYVGVALTTLATLVLELSLTRIFSVVFYYHFAFLAISIALFGLGAGGVLSYLSA